MSKDAWKSCHVPSRIRGGGGGGVSTETYYAYQLSLPHQSLSPDKPIYAYDAYGELVYTIEANSPDVDYGTGVYTVPGTKQNTVIESIATASYYVKYSAEDVMIDYDKAEFSINNTLISKPTSVTVWATFEYYTQFTASNDTRKIIDGDWSTQMQTIFYAPPPQSYQYAILDFGVARTIQTIDLIGGYFRPTDDVKFNCKYNATLKYSLDNISYYDISTDTHNFTMDSGSAVSFDEDKLGVDFTARYIQIVLESVDKINYSKSSIIVTDSNYQQLVDAGIINEDENNHAVAGDTIILREGLYAVALTEASAYSDIILKAECLLIPTTIGISLVGDTLTVDSTAGFSSSGTAYIDMDEDKSFTYTGITSTQFLGVSLHSGASFTTQDYITQTIEDDNSLYDYNMLLPKMGDRIYKKNQSKEEYLYTESDLAYLSKAYLREFVKNHGKLQAELTFAPYLKLGQTVSVTDTFGKLNADRYFIEAITYRPNGVSATLARYPG